MYHASKSVKAAHGITVKQGGFSLSSYAGLAMFTNMLDHLECGFRKLNKMCPRSSSRGGFQTSTVIKNMITLTALGQNNYCDVRYMNDDALYVKVNDGRKISQETIRQRLDELANKNNFDQAYQILDEMTVESLKCGLYTADKFVSEPSQLDARGNVKYYVLDIDVTVLNNEGSHKENVGYTYKNVVGYAPIMAYLGKYALCFELRPGTQHCEKGAVDFLNRCARMIKKLGIDTSKVIVRVDSGHDAVEFMKACIYNGFKFIISRNFRREKMNLNADDRAIKNNAVTFNYGKKHIFSYTRWIEEKTKPAGLKDSDIYNVMEIQKQVRSENSNTKFLLPIVKEIRGFWTNIKKENADNIIELYHNHATSEQYHSELKTDIGIERLASGKFHTNYLLLQISAIAFNFLRYLGETAISIDERLMMYKEQNRIRFKTVLQKIIIIPCQIVRHARRFEVITTNNFLHKEAFFYLCQSR